MGLLLSFLRDKQIEDVFLDFEKDGEPTDKELQIYERVAATLERGKKVLVEIEDYKGCQELARKVENLLNSMLQWHFVSLGHGKRDEGERRGSFQRITWVCQLNQTLL